jgi:hypothetical protein
MNVVSFEQTVFAAAMNDKSEAAMVTANRKYIL